MRLALSELALKKSMQRRSRKCKPSKKLSVTNASLMQAMCTRAQTVCRWNLLWHEISVERTTPRIKWDVSPTVSRTNVRLAGSLRLPLLW